jgi:hypothetical protein
MTVLLESDNTDVWEIFLIFKNIFLDLRTPFRVRIRVYTLSYLIPIFFLSSESTTDNKNQNSEWVMHKLLTVESPFIQLSGSSYRIAPNYWDIWMKHETLCFTLILDDDDVCLKIMRMSYVSYVLALSPSSHYFEMKNEQCNVSSVDFSYLNAFVFPKV